MIKTSWVVRACDGVIRWTLLALLALVPVFFLPFTLEVLEFNKQTLLLTGAAVAGLAWVGKMLAERRFEYRRTIVNTVVLLYVAVYAVSAIVSDSPYLSISGDYGQAMAGLTTTVALVILYFVAINNIRTVRTLNAMLLALVIGGFLSGLYALLQGLGIHLLPFQFAQSASFNTVGTIGSLCLYQAFIVTLIGGLLMRQKSGEPAAGLSRVAGIARTVLMVLTAVIGLFLIAVLDFWPVTACLLVGSALVLGFAFLHARDLKGIGGALLPMAAVLVSLLILAFRFPVSLPYPAEVMPSMGATADIASQTLRESSFFGSGPGTFIYDYAKHRPTDINSTSFWDIRFDRGFSSFLTILATTGLLGGLSWLIMSIFLLVAAGRRLFRANDDGWPMLIGVFAAWFLLILSRFLYSSTVSLEFAVWMMMAFLVIVHRKEFLSVQFERSPRAAMGLSFLFILGLVFAVSGAFVEVQRYRAEVNYAQAISLDQAGGDVGQVIDRLTEATRLNARSDAYVRNLGLSLLAKANIEAGKPIDLERNDGESDDTYQTRLKAVQADRVRAVAALAGDAVNVAKRATEMNPANVTNWSVLASVYQKLFGVSQGADEWAVKSYEKAIELEPANPEFRNQLGQVYLYQADVQAEAAGKIEGQSEAKTQAETSRDDLYAKAAASFQEAIELKSDYAPAHFFLGVALDRQGKLKEAILKMEQVLSYSPQDVGVGFQLALLYYRDGRKDEAMGLMESVVKLSPDYSNALWYLASMHEEKGNLDRAIELLKKVVSLNRDNQLIAQKLADLEAKKAAPPEGTVLGPDGLPVPVEQAVTDPNAPGVKKP